MGNFFRESELVTAAMGDQRVECLHCHHTQFGTRRVKLNTSGAEFFGLAWANRESLALICDNCGALHEFLEGVVKTRGVLG